MFKGPGEPQTDLKCKMAELKSCQKRQKKLPEFFFCFETTVCVDTCSAKDIFFSIGAFVATDTIV